MEKDTQKLKFIIEYIYEDIKDKMQINTTSHLRFYLEQKNIDLTNEEIRKLYIRITNYRIQKYGNSVIFKECPRQREYTKYDDYLKHREERENDYI